ncbi:hypothetical protein AB0K02_22815 [Streptomyces sp. NPDC049597]|uniref:hypothetical protein n=1 Tax=Streptomyces sp. NPDC049597 TaxID=3155276 RepID=UPI003441D654
MTTTDSASTPPRAPEHGQDKSRLRHYVVTALVADGSVNYVLYTSTPRCGRPRRPWEV